MTITTRLLSLAAGLALAGSLAAEGPASQPARAALDATGTAQAPAKPAKAKKAKPATASPAKKEKTKASAAPAKHQHWVCPMHDGGESDHPGPCPKCGMDLVLEEDSAPAKP